MNFNEYLQNYGYADTEDLTIKMKNEGKTENEIEEAISDYSEKYEEECKLMGEEATFI